MAASKSQTKRLEIQESQRTSARDWKSKSIGKDLTLPSGVVVLVKRLGPTAILTGGFVPDSLAPVINEAIREGKGLPPEKQAELAQSPQQIADMLEMMDSVLVKAVVDPPVHRLPPCISEKTGEECGLGPLDAIHQDNKLSDFHLYVGGDKDEDLVYVDEVDFEDKTFVFQYVVGGSSDLERFRKEQAGNVADVSDGEDVELPS